MNNVIYKIIDHEPTIVCIITNYLNNVHVFSHKERNFTIIQRN